MTKKTLRQEYTEFIMNKRKDSDEMYELFLQSLSTDDLEELAYAVQVPDDDFD